MKSAAVKKTAGQPGPQAEDSSSNWQHFPVFERILSSEEPSPVMAKIEKTCRQLNDVVQTGSEADKSRAKLAMSAYGRSLDLLRSLTEARNKLAEQK